MNKTTYIFAFKSTFYLLARNYMSCCLSIKSIKNGGLLVSFKMEAFHSFVLQVLEVRVIIGASPSLSWQFQKSGRDSVLSSRVSSEML